MSVGSEKAGDHSVGTETPIEKKVTRRAGGRHLVFRIRRPGWSMVPRPYAVISNIEGAILVFYGAGQLWLSHRKLRRINDWWVRIPRLASRRIVSIIDRLQPQIADFIDEIRKLKLIGTLIIERRKIEFHWTVRPAENPGSSIDATRRQAVIDLNFNKLVSEFAGLQLVGQEGVDDTSADQVTIRSVE